MMRTRCLSFLALLIVCVGASSVLAAGKVLKKPDPNQLGAKISITQPSTSVNIDIIELKEYKIEWSYNGLRNGKSLDGTLVTVKLLQNGTFKKIIADNVAIGSDNKGFYLWNLGMEETGMSYQIQVQSKAYNDVAGTSVKFSISCIK